MTFEDAVRALARIRGAGNITDETPVQVEYGHDEEGHSEYTIYESWNEITVRCGEWVATYRCSSAYLAFEAGNAFALLMRDLDEVEVPEEVIRKAEHAGVPPHEAVDLYANDPAHVVGAWERLAALGAGGAYQFLNWEDPVGYEIEHHILVDPYPIPAVIIEDITRDSSGTVVREEYDADGRLLRTDTGTPGTMHDYVPPTYIGVGSNPYGDVTKPLPLADVLVTDEAYGRPLPLADVPSRTGALSPEVVALLVDLLKDGGALNVAQPKRVDFLRAQAEKPGSGGR